MKTPNIIAIIGIGIALGMMIYGYTANNSETVGLSALAFGVIVAWRVTTFVFRARGGKA